MGVIVEGAVAKGESFRSNCPGSKSLVGDCPGEIFMGGSCPMGSCPLGN